MLKEVGLVALGATEYMTSMAYQNQLAFIGCVAAVGLSIMGVAHVWHKARRRFRLLRGKRMTREERIQYRKMLVADILTDGLEKAEELGKLNRYEVQELYRRVGKYLSNGELIPRKLHPQAIAKKVKSSPSMVVDKEVNIPGPKPGEGDNLIPFPDYLEKKDATKLGAGYLARKAKVA